MQNQENAIDFVIPWVDGGDPAWRQEKARYSGETLSDDRDERYRDWDNLRYWFRGVEKYAPWVRKVFFITWGHVPEWLDTGCEKLCLVKHEDYIPKEYLPTFNSNAIELNIHRIEGLSGNFVYFNDDMFLIKPVQPSDYFRGGIPRDMLALQPVVANPDSPVMSYIYINNSMVLSRHFKKRENFRMQWRKYLKPGYPLLHFGYNLMEQAFPLFTGFYTVHGPSPFCLHTFEKIWQKEQDLLEEVSSHKFRDRSDVSQYLIREWQKLSGEFCPGNVEKDFRYFNVGNSNAQLLDTICKQKAKCICINDANVPIDFDRVKGEICDAFEKILPEKSAFEK